MKASSLRVNGMQVHHVDVGMGEPIVLIHGITATHRYWKQNVAHLAERRRVLALDLPGFGRSEKPDADYSLDFFVRAVIDFLDTKNIRRASLIGNSLGGLIAMATAIDHPKRVERLVLVDPAVQRMPFGAFSRVMKLMERGFALARRAGATAPPKVPVRVIEALFQAVFPGQPELAKRYVRSYTHAMQTAEYPLHMRTAFRAAHGVLRRPMQAQASAISHPTLIVWGARDFLMPVWSAHKLRTAIPRSELLIYSESGHCPMVDQAERWNRDVTRFLDGERVGR
jgi:pimeloyl-ACP methyl ester carboxylesterase